MTSTALPARPPSRRRRVAAPAVVIAGLVAVTLAVHVRDPHVPGSWGACPSALLGIACPGCGGLRAVHDLTHGDLGGALASNPLVVLAGPLVAVGLVAWLVASWRGRRTRLAALARGPAATALAALLVVYLVLRNVPGTTWLGP